MTVADLAIGAVLVAFYGGRALRTRRHRPGAAQLEADEPSPPAGAAEPIWARAVPLPARPAARLD